MARGVARYLVGSLVVLGLAACGKMWVAERDAWRHEAEVACLKSGIVKEGPLLTRVEPIAGPGICGADFPLKVAAIGEGAPIGYAAERRPPGSVPQPLASPPGGYSRPAYSTYPQPYLAQSEEHTSELQSPYVISYAVFCLKKTTYKFLPRPPWRQRPQLLAPLKLSRP